VVHGNEVPKPFRQVSGKDYFTQKKSRNFKSVDPIFSPKETSPDLAGIHRTRTRPQGLPHYRTGGMYEFFSQQKSALAVYRQLLDLA